MNRYVYHLQVESYDAKMRVDRLFGSLYVVLQRIEKEGLSIWPGGFEIRGAIRQQGYWIGDTRPTVEGTVYQVSITKRPIDS